MCVAGVFVEVQVRVKCVADLARWKLVMVGATVYRLERRNKEALNMHIYILLQVTIFLVA